jgi:hypothetical protein
MLRPGCLAALVLAGATLSSRAPAAIAQEAAYRWPTPTLSDANYSEWLAFIRPASDELKWRNVRWHKSLSEAAAEARRLQRPILLWTMNGHPCGET